MANPPAKVRWAIFLGIALLALIIRLPRLGDRPMHTDEAINAYITGQLLAGDSYQYDPKDRHGPILYAVAWPIAKLCGANSFADLTEQSLRIGPAIAGAGTILLFGVIADEIGMVAANVAALLFAVAPLTVYYSRYFIHETFFVAATLIFIIGGFRALETRSVKHGILTGVGAGLMLACKETATLHFAAFGIMALWWIISGKGEGPKFSSLIKPGAAALVAFCVVIVLLFTWCGGMSRDW